MKKVRVYDLAKEAGMESKALAVKLIELGYDIKGYSSTLNEQKADEVRRILGTVSTLVEEKRIQRKGLKTIIRRRTISVPSVQEEVQEKAVEPEVAEEPVVALGKKEKSAEKPEEPERIKEEAPPDEEVGVKVAVEKAPVPEPEKIPASVEEKVAVKQVEPADAVFEKKFVSTEVEAPAEKEKKTAEPAKPDKPAPKRRKGLARVLGTIELPPEAELSRPKYKRGDKPKAAKPDQNKRQSVKKIRLEPGDKKDKKEGEDKSKGGLPKGKKGKRFVKFHTETRGKERDRKGAGRRKGRVVVAMEDVAGIGGRLASGLRVERARRAGAKKTRHEDAVVPGDTKAIKKRIRIEESISVADIARRMGIKVNEVISKLMELGAMATMNQALDVDTATLVASDFGYEVEQAETEAQVFFDLEDKEKGGEELPRPPVVTIMGHVDHGKTSILDAIRHTDVAHGEAGGITQHIGAHYVRSAQGDVVFLDTPGHEAFTEMRARGAKVTDVVVLVVAADDGVMDQTKEAINHARAAEVPIVVAVNKIDKPDANPDRVKRELGELDLLPEEWGGRTIFCETSAKTGEGIDELLEQILLQSEILELKADSKRKARGRVIEAHLHKGRGPVATILVQHGTLEVGDNFVVGEFYGRVRALTNDKGVKVKQGGPSMPVEVHGLSGVPRAGDEFVVMPDEKMAKNVSQQRRLKSRDLALAATTKISLDNLFEKLKEGEVKELRVILRADVQGTLEAFGSAIKKLSTDEIRVEILHEGTGAIIDSDVLLASASNAIIIGFNVRPSAKVQDFAKNEKVDIRYYDVIYNALDDIRKAMTGMLEPVFVERTIGSVEVRQTIHVSKVGMIAGSYVADGKVTRDAHVRLLRDGVVVYTGRISSLRRFKDDVKEVQTNFECGIGLENFNDIKNGDMLEIFVVDEIAAEL
ncbi:MAG: translation initiation factor IF-2 [Thermodesulfobacteriota bacterium]|nr:translation initiation factor IF-2 [Thermodesulfobacteriota bacterium]